MDTVNKTRSIAVDINNKLVFPQISELIEANPELGGGNLLDNIVTDITDLQQTKANRGEFWFNKGTLTCANRWSTDSAFSYVFTFAMSQDDWTNMKGMHYGHWVNTADYVSSGNECGVWFGDVGDRLAVRLAYKKSDGTFGSKDIVTSSAQWIPYLDNKSHIICASFSNGIFKLRIDEKEIGSVSVPDFTPSENSQYFTIRSYGKISDVVVFNFDITDANAPYTIADYIAGKDESPLLQGSQPVLDWSYYGNATKTDNTLDYSYEYVGTFIYPRPIGDSLLEAGKTYKFVFRSSSTSAMPRLYARTGDATKTEVSWQYTNLTTGEVGSGSSIGINATAIFGTTATTDTIESVLTIKPAISHSIYFTMNGGTTLEAVSIQQIGALLSLDDYSIEGKVLDISGNNNHATITGAVYGSKSSSVETLIENITNNNADVIQVSDDGNTVSIHTADTTENPNIILQGSQTNINGNFIEVNGFLYTNDGNIGGNGTLVLTTDGAFDTTASVQYDKISFLIGQNDPGANFDFNIDGTFTGYKHAGAGDSADTNTGFSLGVSDGLNITLDDEINSITKSAIYSANGINLSDTIAINHLSITNTGITYQLDAPDHPTSEITLDNNGINIKPGPDYQSSNLVGGISITGDMLKLNGVPEDEGGEGGNRVEITNKAISFYDCYENIGLEITDYYIDFKRLSDSYITNLKNITIRNHDNDATISINGDKISFGTGLVIGETYDYYGYQLFQAVVGEADISGMLTTKLLRDDSNSQIDISPGEYTDCLLNKLSKEYFGTDPDTEEPVFSEHDLDGFDKTAVGLDYFYNVIKELNARIKELESTVSSTDPVDQIKLKINGTDEYCIVKAEKGENGAITLTVE